MTQIEEKCKKIPLTPKTIQQPTRLILLRQTFSLSKIGFSPNVGSYMAQSHMGRLCVLNILIKHIGCIDKKPNVPQPLLDMDYTAKQTKCPTRFVAQTPVPQRLWEMYTLTNHADILQKIQSSHSKMNQLYYSELKLQEYFKIPGIETKEMLNLFKWRVRMAPLGENFRGNRENVLCPLCGNHLDSQPTFLQCEVIKKELTTNTKIEDIYVENVSLETAKTITRIEDTRKAKLKSLENE